VTPGDADRRARDLGVLALALLALATTRTWSNTLRLCVATVAGTVAVHCVFFGGDRYHFVFTPLLCVIAGGVLAARGRG